MNRPPVWKPAPKTRVDPGPAKRLKLVREAAGYDTAHDASKALGIPKVTYAHHESAERGISRQKAAIYADAFNVSATYILYGDLETKTHATPVEVVGVLSHNGRIVAMPKGSTLPRHVPAPPTNEKQELKAVLVTGDEMFPAYRVGDVIYYAVEPGDSPSQDFAGVECVVETTAGERLVRFATLQKDGLFTLSAYKAPVTPNVALLSCSPIVWVRKGTILT
jgi:hypothetical protein